MKATHGQLIENIVIATMRCVYLNELAEDARKLWQTAERTAGIDSRLTLRMERVYMDVCKARDSATLRKEETIKTALGE